MYEASVRIIDSMPEPGGQLTALYPEKNIFDVPGFTRITAKELAGNLFTQANQFAPDLCLNETVVEIIAPTIQSGTELNSVPKRVVSERGGTIFQIVTDKGRYLSKTVIIAAGLGAFKPRGLMKPGIDKFEGKGVYYAVREKDYFKERM